MYIIQVTLQLMLSPFVNLTNHVRAVTGLKKEKVKKISNAEMHNILGDEILKFRNKSLKTDEFFFDYGKKSNQREKENGPLNHFKKIILFYSYTMHNSCTVFNFASFMHYTKVVPNHYISFFPCVRKYKLILINMVY